MNDAAVHNLRDAQILMQNARTLVNAVIISEISEIRDLPMAKRLGVLGKEREEQLDNLKEVYRNLGLVEMVMENALQSASRWAHINRVK